jgi:hypothetical protein
MVAEGVGIEDSTGREDGVTVGLHAVNMTTSNKLIK